jgi:transcriptional regulator with XRE-family HTH domain
MAFNEATARWESHEYDEPGLGQVLADERFRQLRLQRTVAAASGITQPKLSAYERGRLIPSWEVFVRVLAAHLLGTGEQVELIYVSVEGDPERLDEFAAAIANRNRAVTTKRGGGVRPHVAFDHGGRRIALELMREARRSIEVEYDGRRVRVAPMEDIYGEL